MRIEITEKSIKTEEKCQIIDITDQIKDYIADKDISEGQITITTKHTTSAIRINENEERLLKDFKKYLEEIIPEERHCLHDDIEERKNCPDDEPKNGHAHLTTLLLGASETIPIKDGKLNLGQWQRIFFIELDGPRDRTFSMTLIAN